jgi:hypothetical protein
VGGPLVDRAAVPPQVGLLAECLVELTEMLLRSFREVIVFFQETIQLAFAQVEESLHLLPAKECDVPPGQDALSLVKLLYGWCRATC